jgi:CPA1 family monovalent cation:H+ antiporter
MHVSSSPLSLSTQVLSIGVEDQPVVSIMGGLLVLLVLSVLARAVARRLEVPDALPLVATGAVVGALADRIDMLSPIRELAVTPGVAFFVFLPTLVFHSAISFDGRALRKNLAPILTLAVPALVLSTAVIGCIMMWLSSAFGMSLSWPEAMLLGSILAATEPVAVVSMLSRVGAPKRLKVLVEGESLFNDATAIVLSRVLLSVMAAGALGSALVDGLVLFVFVFVGGAILGWLLGRFAGTILGAVEGDALFEITITTILAYLAFYLGEYIFQVSGVMSVVVAGIVIGGWGRTKISPSVSQYLDSYWEYVSGLANWLVFVLVGLTVDFGTLVAAPAILVGVVAAMFLSRAVAIYTLVPAVNRAAGAEPIDRGYQTVILWGGVRGGIALAIALALPVTVPSRELLISLTTGAVIVSLVVQTFTIERVVRHFRLDGPPISDRFAQLEARIAARARTLAEIPKLQRGGLFSRSVATEMRSRAERALESERAALDELRGQGLDRDEERRLLYLRCFAAERSQYYRMLAVGHLTERTYRELAHGLDLQIEGMRDEGRLPDFTLHPSSGERRETRIYRLLERVPGLRARVEQLRAVRAARDYQVAWARYRGDQRVLTDLDELADTIGAREEVVDELRAFYVRWRDQARARLDQTAELFPEFVTAAQRRLAARLAVHAVEDELLHRVSDGVIPEGVANAMLARMRGELSALRATEAEKLLIGPEELLKRVPFFAALPAEEFSVVAQKLNRRTAPTGDRITTQGRPGATLYLIARGVVRVTRTEADVDRDVATLMAGDFFGEMALLHGGVRRATCRAVAPSVLYELRRADIDLVCGVCPQMKTALEEADRVRREELDALARASLDFV